MKQRLISIFLWRMDGDDGGGMKQYDDHEMITWDVWVCNIERKYDDEKKI